MSAGDGHPDDLLELYALDALQPDQRNRVEQHVARCDRCRAEVARNLEASAVLADEVAADPPAGLRNSVLTAIADLPQEGAASTSGRVEPMPQTEPVVPHRRSLNRAMLAMAAVVLVAVSGVLLALRPQEGSPSSELAEAVDARSLALTAVSDQIESGRIEVVWSPAVGKLAVDAAELADPGPGRTYALWFLLADGVAPAGLFDPESGSFDGVLDLDDIDNLDDLDPIGWGVTIEPDGGSPQPTGEVLYAAVF